MRHLFSFLFEGDGGDVTAKVTKKTKTKQKRLNDVDDLAHGTMTTRLCFLSLQHKARVEAMMCDLASLRSVREFADSFKAKKL